MLRVVALLVGTVVVVALGAFALNSSPTLVACFSGQPSRGGELHTDLVVDPRIKTMSFSMVVNQISRGAVRWLVVDPIGQSRWSGREESLGIFESGTITAITGRWTINVVSDADALTYGVIWKSLDPAIAPHDPICGVPL